MTDDARHLPAETLANRHCFGQGSIDLEPNFNISLQAHDEFFDNARSPVTVVSHTSIHCRLLIFATALLGTAIAAQQPIAAQEKPLYEATIVSEEGIVRSGPGATHYGTDRLAPGTKVQVYREDPGGWMAIRPPNGSFSLMQLSELEMINDRVAKVTKTDGALVWVGTRLSAVNKPMWQIRKQKGETVHVLGTVDRDKFNLTDNQPDWIQIAPPAGEFRWIAGKHLKTESNSRGSVRFRQQPEQRKPMRLSEQDLDGLQIDIGDETNFDNEDGFDSGFQAIGTGENTNNAGLQDDSTSNPAVQRQFDNWDSGFETTRPVNSGAPNNRSLDGGSSNSNRDWSMDIEGGDQSAGWKPARQPISKFVEQRSRFVSDTPNGQGNRLGNSGFASNSNSYNSNGMAGSATRGGMRNNDPNSRSNIFDASDSIVAASNFDHGSGTDSSYNTGSSLNTPNLRNTGQLATGSTNQSLQQRMAIDLPPGHPIHSLELALSNEMAGKSPAEWDLTRLANEAERMKNQTRDPNELKVLDHILQKLNNCRQIKAGYRATGDEGRDLQARNPGNRFASNASQQAGQQSSSTNNNVLLNYDASGYLAELVRDNGTSPSTFVLKDAGGRITHHVAAPPGLNLRRYLNQRVGIIGNRGYNQQLRMEHVTAERITTVRR